MSLLISHDKLFSLLHKLAKSNYWQTVYSQAKEISGLNLFKNNLDFTYLQLQFLAELSFCSSLYIDVMMGDVSEKVLENEIYSDSYAHYKNQQRKKSKKESKSDNFTKSTSQLKEEVINKNQWVFTKVKGK
jgi:hypothetical protein